MQLFSAGTAQPPLYGLVLGRPRLAFPRGKPPRGVDGVAGDVRVSHLHSPRTQGSIVLPCAAVQYVEVVVVVVVVVLWYSSTTTTLSSSQQVPVEAQYVARQQLQMMMILALLRGGVDAVVRRSSKKQQTTIIFVVPPRNLSRRTYAVRARTTVVAAQSIGVVFSLDVPDEPQLHAKHHTRRGP